MADNYLERKYEAYIERKAKAEKEKRAAWKKRMDAYRKKLAAQEAAGAAVGSDARPEDGPASPAEGEGEAED